MVIDTINRNNMFSIYKGYSKAFNISCLVHATKQKSFENLLKTGFMSIKVPEYVESKRVGMMEAEFNLDKCVWLSIGFVYNAQLEDDYGFIFSSKIIDKSFEVFNYMIMSLIHKELIRYWRDKDKKYLDYVLNNTNKEIILSFLETDKKGNANDFGNFPWWEIREDLFKFYNNYPKKTALKKHLSKIREEDKITKAHTKYVDKMYKDLMITRGEIVTHKDVYLDNSHLIGLFVKKSCATKNIKNRIKTFVESAKHIDKDSLLIFDGDKKIKYEKFV